MDGDSNMWKDIVPSPSRAGELPEESKAMRTRETLTLTIVLVALGGLVACDEPQPPSSTYFDDRIAPLLQASCVQQTTGCHISDERGIAAGNLDLSSYDALMRRRDALAPHGPYPLGLLLMKISDPLEIDVQTFDPPDPAEPDDFSVTIRTDIRHAAGAGVGLDSAGFRLIKEWIDSGFARDGVPVENDAENAGACAHGPDPDEARFDPEAPVDDVGYERFVSTVQPILREKCAGSSCHGNLLRIFYLSCGDDEEELKWNYFASTWHLNDPAHRSELLRRPLARRSGGAPHQGGDVFENTADDDYRAILEWAQDLIERDPMAIRDDEFYATDSFRFFLNRVQPVLVRKGCMFQSCHSLLTQRLKFVGGSQGSFSRMTQHRNHGALLEFFALASEDPNQSRVVAKNLFPPELVEGGEGIFHRGGSLLEDFGMDGAEVNRASPDDCEGYDVDNGDLNEIPAYCILVRSHELERAEARRWDSVNEELLNGIIWVARPLGIGEVTDFDTYRPGADLRIAAPFVAEDGSLSLGPWESALEGCDLDQATADIRGPAVSWDGIRVAFAARSSADEPLRLYWMNEDGSACEPIPNLAAPVAMENGILTHDFDPAFAPDGELVFASTRGNVDRDAYDYAGPTRTPAGMQPNANMYVYERFVDPPVRQLSFMLNQELAPSFQHNGFLMYSVEKRQEGFHHLAMRRQNVDGGLFHPFYASRGSLGFESAYDVAQLPTLDFAFVAGPLHAPDGAGTIAIANHSVGADQDDRDPNDPFYLHSMRIPVPGVVGGGRGVFRSPAALPTGRILVSCDMAVTDMAEAPFDFDLCELDTSSGEVRVIEGEAGLAEVEAVAIYQHFNSGVEESDGRGQVSPTLRSDRRDAVVVFHDFQMQASMMFVNTRAGRPIDSRVQGFDVYESLPPPAGTETFADVSGDVVTDEYGDVFISRRLLGHVPLQDDFSAVMRVPGGTPLLYVLTDEMGEELTFPAGSPFEGLLMMPREEDQYYPGERSRRGIRRTLHNAVCGFCHGGMSGRELDSTIDPDSITRASTSLAAEAEPTDLTD